MPSIFAPKKWALVAVLPVAVALALVGAAPAIAATQLLPDLVQAPPTKVQIGGGAGNWQIGFQSEVSNQGLGAFEVRGHRSSTNEPLMTADQAIYMSDGSVTVVPNIGNLHFAVDPTHQHWHFMPFDHYELRTLAGSLVGTDVKQGFCLGDNDRAGSALSPAYGSSIDSTWCQKYNTQALSVTEGISVGWADPYDPLKEGQAIPIDQSKVPTGDYNLVHRVNESPDGSHGPVLEQDWSDNVASDWVKITWANGKPTIAVQKSCQSTASCGPVPEGTTPPAAPPQPPPTPKVLPTPAPIGVMPDTAAPRLHTALRVNKRFTKRSTAIALVVSCNEQCTVTTQGRSRVVIARTLLTLPANLRTRVLIPVTRAQRKSIAQALARHRRVTVRTKVKATDLSGNVATKLVTVRLHA
jgi:hypothetical protein